MKHIILIFLLINVCSSVWAEQQAPLSGQKAEQQGAATSNDGKKALAKPKPQFAKKVLPFPEPKMERNYNWLTNNLRCQKCANQTLADSQVDLAADLRDRVYQQVLTGKSKEEIVKFLMKRFGDRVSYDPPFRAVTVLLWTSPFLLFLYGFLVMKKAIRNRGEKTAENTRELSSDEEHKLAVLLGESEIPVDTDESRSKDDHPDTDTTAHTSTATKTDIDSTKNSD